MQQIVCAVAALLVMYGSSLSTPVQARLGEEFGAFRTRILHGYEQAGQRGNNFFFKLKLTPRQTQMAPGYAVGITATVMDGKITGESMACIIGKNGPLGSTLASLEAFTFTCEATGKPLPQEQKEGQLEFSAFAKIVQHALDGQPQSFSYPGYPSKINIVVDKTRRLLIACSPQQEQKPPPPPIAPPEASKPTAPKPANKPAAAARSKASAAKKPTHK
jgi:hypothetical protein